MTYEELINAQDKQRTQRSFISLLSGALGVDQSYAEQDYYARNPPGQYTTVSPYGVSVEGLPLSNQQAGIRLTLPVLLLIAGGVYLALK